MIWNATKFMQFSCHLFWTKYYVYVSPYFKKMIWNATNSYKFHVIGSEIMCIYIMIVYDTKIFLEMQPIHANFMSLVLKLYIYVCVCSHLISPCCSPCWWVFLHFSISSPGDFISFPHLFDHFIKRIWSVLISLSQKMFPTYFFILLFGSSAVPSFPNLFLQLIIIVCLQFSKVCCLQGNPATRQPGTLWSQAPIL